MYGSTFFEYYARNILELRKVQEEDEDNLDIALYNTFHNLGRKLKPQGFHLSFNGTGTHIEQTEITAPELLARLGTQARIKALLLRGDMPIKDIAAELELSETSCRMAVSRLCSKGTLVKTPKGYGVRTKAME